MTDPLETLLENAFSEATREAHDPALIASILARIDRRARIEKMVWSGVVVLGSACGVLLALPGLQQLADLFVAVEAMPLSLAAASALGLAVASPWLVAMLDDRV